MSNEDRCWAWLHACLHAYEHECAEMAARGRPCPPAQEPKGQDTDGGGDA